jgi:transcriptional regulator with XRE-family HTH domain
MDLGATIRARRTALGLTLDALSERTNVSRAMLSDIERGLKSPTVRVVSQIAEGLGCQVSQLLGERSAESAELMQVTRLAERRMLVDPHSGVERHLLAPAFLRRGVEVLWYTIPPGCSTGTFPAHRAGVEEHITVVRGSVRCIIGDRVVELDAGDSIIFQADSNHEFENIGSELCECFFIIDSSRVGSLPV